MNLPSHAEVDENVSVHGRGVSLSRHILSSEITKPSSYWGDLSASIKGKGKIPVPY